MEGASGRERWLSASNRSGESAASAGARLNPAGMTTGIGVPRERARLVELKVSFLTERAHRNWLSQEPFNGSADTGDRLTLAERGQAARDGSPGNIDMHRLLTSLIILGAVSSISVGGAVASTSKGNQATAPAAQMLLKLGDLKTDPKLERLSGALHEASRQALGELPGVRLLENMDEPAAAGSKRKPPVVLITGKLVELGQKADGEDVLVSAKVEYFVHRMPGESIAAVVSGVATARVAPIQMQKRRLRERLERSIVTAAVESAAKRTPPALRAAIK